MNDPLPSEHPTVGRPYAVRPGDTISSIAFRAFGDARRYPEIYEYNRERIGPKPTQRAPGLVIHVPSTDYLCAPRSLFGRGTVGRTFNAVPVDATANEGGE